MKEKEKLIDCCCIYYLGFHGTWVCSGPCSLTRHRSTKTIHVERTVWVARQGWLFAGDIWACLTLGSWFMHRQGGRGYSLMQTVYSSGSPYSFLVACSRNGRIAGRL